MFVCQHAKVDKCKRYINSAYTNIHMYVCAYESVYVYVYVFVALSFLPKHLVGRPVCLCALICFKPQRLLPADSGEHTPVLLLLLLLLPSGHKRIACCAPQRVRKQNYTLFILFIFHFCAVSASSSYAVASNVCRAVALLPWQWLHTNTHTETHTFVCNRLSARVLLLLLLFLLLVNIFVVVNV